MCIGGRYHSCFWFKNWAVPGIAFDSVCFAQRYNTKAHSVYNDTMGCFGQRHSRLSISEANTEVTRPRSHPLAVGGLQMRTP